MTLPRSHARTPLNLDELTVLAAHATQLVPDDTLIELDDSGVAAAPPGPPVEDGQMAEESAAEESANHAPLQTREAYLKKGEDLIRSLL